MTCELSPEDPQVGARLEELLSAGGERTLDLGPGLWRLPRVPTVLGDLTLVGGPGTDLLLTRAFPLHVPRSQRLTLRGLTLRREGTEGDLLRVNGALTADGCHFQARPGLEGQVFTNGNGVLAWGAAQVTLRDCRFDGMGRHGLRVGGQARATLRGCVVEGCRGDGVRVERRGRLELDGVRMVDNKGCGVHLRDRSQGRLEGCDLEDCGLDGVRLRQRARLTVLGSVVRWSGLAGLAFEDRSGGVAEGCTFSDNQADGVRVSGRAAPQLLDDVMVDNEGCGVAWLHRSGGLARGNQVLANSWHGLGIFDRATPTIEDNRLEGHGVFRASEQDDKEARGWTTAPPGARPTSLGPPPSPRLTDFAEQGPDLSFTLQGGADLTGMRWGQLPEQRVGGVAAWGGGWPCSTCEAHLTHLGWPRPLAHAEGARMSALTAQPPPFSAQALRALAPLLGSLADGEYLSAELNLPLRGVGWRNPRHSPYAQRHADRREHHGERFPYHPDMPVGALRVPHSVGPMLERHEQGMWCSTYTLVLPGQPPEWLDPGRVAWYRAAILGGARPVVVTSGWIDERYVSAWFLEAFFHLVVLDGHHKLAAYQQLGVPARLWMALRLEDSFGGPEQARTQLLRTLKALRDQAD